MLSPVNVAASSADHEPGYDARDYQEIGTNFLRNVRRGFLTDAAGLGKTIQAIRAAELPAMVVAPKYLGVQWADAIRREHPDAVIAHADGTRTQRDKILDKKADWYVVNLEMLSTYELPTDIRTFINDESQHLRTRQATQSKAAFVLENVDSTSRIYHLTATPFWKNVADIWMQAHILYPSVFTSYHQFVKLYCTSIQGPYGPRIIGVKKAMRSGLKELLQPIMLGRTYADVGRFLPDTVDTVIKLDLNPTLRALYEKLLSEYSLQWETDADKMIFSPTTILHVLRQITAQVGKFDAIEHLLEDNFDEPTVIGFWYKDHARMMHSRLGSRAVLITGDIPATERHKRATWAHNNGKHIVASQMSLEEGINLHKYRMFIFAEQNYVPGSNHQFLSRVVRDRNDGGRDTEPVRVYYIQARKTVDEHIYKVSKSRGTSIEATRQLLSLTLGIGKSNG